MAERNKFSVIHLDIESRPLVVHRPYEANKFHVLQCVRCKERTSLEPCTNCGGVEYFASSRSSISCRLCRLSTNRWRCKKCGTDNPMQGALGEMITKCFVATATFGDYSKPEVVYLSAFRDDILAKSRSGRWFIYLYYVIGPSLAAVLINSGCLRAACRRLILGPLIKLLRLKYRIQIKP